MTIYNFCAGPAMLPKEVMQQAQQELLDWNGLGISVMEISHRSEPYMQMAAEAEADLRELMQVPDDYHVLFLHGGGRGQFSSVPLNISNAGQSSDHIVTGHWSNIAVSECDKYLATRVVGKSDVRDGLVTLPTQQQLALDDNAAFLHYCPNETINGVEFNWVPDAGRVPVVADMSSNILSATLDVSKFGVIYAGAQKNIGPSGLGVVIVREDLVGHARKETPSIFDYQLAVKHQSMYNTPPTYSWYLAGLVFKWLKKRGGLPAIEKHNSAKASLLYEAIDASDFYKNTVAPDCRSKMNVPFQLADESLNSLFLAEAEKVGLRALEGHRAVGGMRASIYNAMPTEGVQALVEFMATFEKRHA